MSNFLRANNVSLPECQTGVLKELERDEIENHVTFLKAIATMGLSDYLFILWLNNVTMIFLTILILKLTWKAVERASFQNRDASKRIHQDALLPRKGRDKNALVRETDLLVHM